MEEKEQVSNATQALPQLNCPGALGSRPQMPHLPAGSSAPRPPWAPPPTRLAQQCQVLLPGTQRGVSSSPGHPSGLLVGCLRSQLHALQLPHWWPSPAAGPPHTHLLTSPAQGATPADLQAALPTMIPAEHLPAHKGHAEESCRPLRTVSQWSQTDGQGARPQPTHSNWGSAAENQAQGSKES